MAPRYGFIGEIAEFTGIGTDVPQPGVNYGPVVIVAEGLWDWSATRGRYVPGNAVVYALITDAPALANTAQDIGIEAWLVNPLTPTGKTRIYWTGTLWAPVAGQILYRANGTLLDMIAGALSIGAWNEVWQSSALPLWMIAGDPTISVSADAEIADPSSTAVCKLRLRLDTISSSLGDESNGFVGTGGAASSFGRGFSGARYRGNIIASRLYVTFGAQPYNPSVQPHRSAALLTGGTLRMRVDAWPGATTNTIKIFSVDLWSGS